MTADPKGMGPGARLRLPGARVFAGTVSRLRPATPPLAAGMICRVRLEARHSHGCGVG